ncbi:hypothetical protein ACJJTC_019088 [Scirpophaga incertulas]
MNPPDCYRRSSIGEDTFDQHVPTAKYRLPAIITLPLTVVPVERLITWYLVQEYDGVVLYYAPLYRAVRLYAFDLRNTGIGRTAATRSVELFPGGDWLMAAGDRRARDITAVHAQPEGPLS